ncbi:hypothetical protein Mapa_011924 [Marchantia paleacea]|nr:hypothetical protein Mapa_011924 [Marchantia paleacea]
MDNNQFLGPISINVSIAPIQIMRLDNNKLIGPIPDVFSTIKSLTEIHVSNNALTRTILDLSACQPIRPANYTSLFHIWRGWNKCTSDPIYEKLQFGRIDTFGTL